MMMMRAEVIRGWGGEGGCGSVRRASDRHATETGSIPRCGKGFFYQSQLSVTSVRCALCAIAWINICAHVKQPVVHFRVRWIMETLEHPACTIRLDSATLSQLAFLEREKKKSNPNFAWEKSQWDNTIGKKT